MAKLIDEMKTMRAYRREEVGEHISARIIHHGGSTCPFCGERKVTEYLHVSVKTRNTPGSQGRASLPGFWQGICHDCVMEIVTDLGRRARRDDYLKKLGVFDEQQGPQEDTADAGRGAVQGAQAEAEA